MDLGAYRQIERLSKIAADNGINVPRLRGYRLMSEEKAESEEEAMKAMLDRAFYVDMATSCPAFAINPCGYELSRRTKWIRKKYLTKDETDLRWDKLHGKKRKNAKYLVKTMTRKTKEQLSAYNRYAGQEGVLYIHARIGGYNWNQYGGKDLEKEPWFLEKVDDAYDGTYCDIYARVVSGDGRIH